MIGTHGSYCDAVPLIINRPVARRRSRIAASLREPAGRRRGAAKETTADFRLHARTRLHVRTACGEGFENRDRAGVSLGPFPGDRLLFVRFRFNAELSARMPAFNRRRALRAAYVVNN